MPASHFKPFAPAAKPDKPYPDFPLFPHAAGVWAKKIRGKLHYFGPWSDPDGALAKYNAEREALHAGKRPRAETGAGTVKDLCNAFLNHKQTLVDNGELSPATFRDYREGCDEVVACFGKGRAVADLGPDDFARLRERMAAKWGCHRLRKGVVCVRGLFKYGFELGLLAVPARFGPAFKGATKKTLRLHRAAMGPKLFTAEEVRKLLDAAGQPMKAMILLGTNCGFGNADCGRLPLAAVDLDRAIIDYPRPKTGIPRRCVLWPETVAALREALARRPTPKRAEVEALFFVTVHGHSWFSTTTAGSKEFAKLMRRVGLNGHRNFYTLRHVFRTVADEAKDQPAADHVMGHESGHMSSVYRETISDSRLAAVAEFVRQWLFGPASVG
jgi:integrase